MPYKRSNKPKYNKAQRAAYKRKSKRYRNRQQLLSVKTVKDIANEVCSKKSELKYRQFGNIGYGGVGDTSTVDHVLSDLHNRANAHSKPLVVPIFNETTIALGTTHYDRIGEQINLEGFRIKCQFKLPVNFYPDDMTLVSSELPPRRINWVRIHLAVIRSIDEPQLDGYPNTFWDNKLMVGRASSEKFKVLYSWTKLFKMPRENNVANIAPPATATSYTSVKQPILLFNKYIKVGKKITISSTPTHIPRGYYLCVWTDQDKMGKGHNNMYNGEHASDILDYHNAFNTKMNYVYSVFFRDP